jgi:hypothetical protein
MLQQMKSRDGVGPRCLVSLAESLDATRKNVMLLFRPLSNAADQAALTRSLNQCDSANAAPILLQEKVAVNGANCEGLSETAAVTTPDSWRCHIEHRSSGADA